MKAARKLQAAKAPAKAKAAPKMKAAPAAKAHRQKLTREESRNRQDDALEMHEAGDSYKEIVAALGFANVGHCFNSVKRARDRAKLAA